MTKTIDINNRRYLGSKAGLLNFIEEVTNKYCGDFNTFADIFAGTGVVANHFAKTNKNVIVNDILVSNFHVYNAWFGNMDVDKEKMQKVISNYNELTVNQDNYFSLHFSNTYYSLRNSRLIGYIREDIEKRYLNNHINEREKSILITSLIYAMDKIANTVGHFDAYRKNGDLESHILNLKMPRLHLNNNRNYIYNTDANELVKKIEADVVYIDPPYNSRQYSDAYHLLENVAEWKKPEVHGTAKKMDRTHIKSKYCTLSAPDAFNNLISNIKAKYIIVSYNNMGFKGAGRSQAKLSDEDIIYSLNQVGSVSVEEKDYKHYTTGKSKITNHKERLFVCEVGGKTPGKTIQNSYEKKLVKSPLNYTGGKSKILPQLLEKFPSNIDTFVDLFGGGFNVGANMIEPETVIYNDTNKQLTRVIKLFYDYEPRDLIVQIEKIIKHFNLSDSFRNGYSFYNCDSNKGLGSYNRKGYYELRDKYNSTRTSRKKDLMLLTLVIFAFNNQIRFNREGFFNMPVGKRDLNNSIRKNIYNFSNAIRLQNIIFKSTDFTKVDFNIDKSTFVYCDPPYYLGVASYNENGGWSIEKEEKLLNYLNDLNEQEVKFALSNVIEHEGKKHEMLINWALNNKYNIIHINSNYSNSNYNKNRTNKEMSKEVLITNY